MTSESLFGYKLAPSDDRDEDEAIAPGCACPTSKRPRDVIYFWNVGHIEYCRFWKAKKIFEKLLKKYNKQLILNPFILPDIIKLRSFLWHRASPFDFFRFDSKAEARNPPDVVLTRTTGLSLSRSG